METTKRPRGRPATFDRERALDRAILLFLRHGYEGSSIAMLTEAMGVTPPTLYSAFESKENLYIEALARYQHLEASYSVPLYQAPTSTYVMVEKILRACAVRFADPLGPKGCMIAIGSLRCGPEDQVVVEATSKARTFALERITDRIVQAKERGEIPQESDTEALSRFLTAVVQGLAIQALDGADLRQLNAIVDVALSAWPQNARRLA